MMPNCDIILESIEKRRILLQNTLIVIELIKLKVNIVGNLLKKILLRKPCINLVN